MTILDTLITDRTRDDVDRALALCAKGWDRLTRAERAEWESGLKGMYGAPDLNRVVGAMEYVDRLMRDAKRDGVYVPTVVQHAVPVEFDAEGFVTRWERRADAVWMDYDYAPGPCPGRRTWPTSAGFGRLRGGLRPWRPPGTTRRGAAA